MTNWLSGFKPNPFYLFWMWISWVSWTLVGWRMSSKEAFQCLPMSHKKGKTVACSFRPAVFGQTLVCFFWLRLFTVMYYVNCYLAKNFHEKAKYKHFVKRQMASLNITSLPHKCPYCGFWVHTGETFAKIISLYCCENIEWLMNW